MTTRRVKAPKHRPDEPAADWCHPPVFSDLIQVFGGLMPLSPLAPRSLAQSAVALPPIPAPPMTMTDGWSCGPVSFSNGMAYFLPPPNYLDWEHNPGGDVLDQGDHEQTRIVFEVRIGNPITGPVLRRHDFFLRRPPVILVHGLYGSGDIEESPDPTDVYWGTSYDPTPNGQFNTRVYKADYKQTNTLGFDVNFSVVPCTIRRAIADYRDGISYFWDEDVDSAHGFPGEMNYAATRADVVGHSMGGCLTRFYMSEVSGIIPRGDDRPNLECVRELTPPLWGYSPPYDWLGRYWFFHRPDNLFAGDIRRFVSIGTPYDGGAGQIFDTIVNTQTIPLLVAVNPSIFAPVIVPLSGRTLAAAGMDAINREQEFQRNFEHFPGGITSPQSVTAVTDLAVNSVAQQLCEGAAPQAFTFNGITGSGQGANYLYQPNSDRWAIFWHPIAGVKTPSSYFLDQLWLRGVSHEVFLPPGTQPAIIAAANAWHAQLMLTGGYPGDDWAERVFGVGFNGLGDGAVKKECALNQSGGALPAPNKYSIFEETSHSVGTSGDYTTHPPIPIWKPENRSAAIAEKIQKLLSRSSYDFCEHGLNSPAEERLDR